MKRSFWISLSISIIVAIFAIQNATTVSIRFLVWNARISLALLLLITFALGAIIGSSLNILSKRKNKENVKDRTSINPHQDHE